MRKLNDFDYKDKRVLLRVDLNVPVLNGEILDETRINKIIPTIKYLHNTGAKVIIASHFGRPKGVTDPAFSLKFLAKHLSHKLELEVIFSPYAIGKEAESLSNNLGPQQILLLENLRFYPGETKNDPEFAKSLAKLADFYVNDAFSCSHRAHASIDKITEFLPSAAGLLLAQEVESLSRHMFGNKRPMMAIIGGSKVSTKAGLIRSLLTQVDYLVIGGAMANSFLKVRGYEIGTSFYEEEVLELVKELAKNKKIILPIDAVVANSISADASAYISEIDSVEANKNILDIGPKSIAQINELLHKCKLVLMNGPVGMFEYPQFSKGTFAIAQEIAKLTKTHKLTSIAGGGDTIAALTQAGAIDDFTYVSTAGGAFLEWLENNNLPGIARLR